MGHDVGCGICETPPGLGTFQGQYTDDVEAPHDAWRWRFEAGQVLFSTDPSNVLDDTTELGYCGLCEQDMREARGIAPNTPIHVTLLKN